MCEFNWVTGSEIKHLPTLHTVHEHERYRKYARELAVALIVYRI